MENIKLNEDLTNENPLDRSNVAKTDSFILSALNEALATPLDNFIHTAMVKGPTGSWVEPFFDITNKKIQFLNSNYDIYRKIDDGSYDDTIHNLLISEEAFLKIIKCYGEETSRDIIKGWMLNYKLERQKLMLLEKLTSLTLPTHLIDVSMYDDDKLHFISSKIIGEIYKIIDDINFSNTEFAVISGNPEIAEPILKASKDTNIKVNFIYLRGLKNTFVMPLNKTNLNRNGLSFFGVEENFGKWIDSDGIVNYVICLRFDLLTNPILKRTEIIRKLAIRI